jgi:hypothetical protein
VKVEGSGVEADSGVIVTVNGIPPGVIGAMNVDNEYIPGENSKVMMFWVSETN